MGNGAGAPNRLPPIDVLSREGLMGNRHLLEALVALLARDEGNTCQHDNTHRGGAIWEICADCGVMWADDMGGKPAWTDPPEWTAARAAIAKARWTGGRNGRPKGVTP
jgi:hypothetical protein